MKKLSKYFVLVCVISLLVSCGKTPANDKKNNISSVEIQSDKYVKSGEKEYLFEAEGMDTIQLKGEDVLEGKEANMSVNISNTISMDFHISRDNPNGTRLYAIYNSQAINLAESNISPNVFEEGEAIEDYYYQICCYDFNMDGEKEIILACGNKNDELSIFLFEISLEMDQLLIPINYIKGYDSAYINEKNEICVPSPKGTEFYRVDIKP